MLNNGEKEGIAESVFIRKKLKSVVTLDDNQYCNLYVEAAPGFFCRVGSAHPIFGSIGKVTNTLVIPRLVYSTYIFCLLSC